MILKKTEEFHLMGFLKILLLNNFVMYLKKVAYFSYL